MFTIVPYKFKGAWVFDEPRVNLDKEQFVMGADKIIELIGSPLNGFEDGFLLTFSNQKPSNYHFSLTYFISEAGGSWYQLDDTDMVGWLCPALFKFFPQAPAKIYVEVKEAPFFVRFVNKLKKKFSLKKPVVMTNFN